MSTTMRVAAGIDSYSDSSKSAGSVLATEDTDARFHGVSNMTLCIAAGYDGGMLVAGDTAGQFVVERDGDRVRGALPMRDQQKLWNVSKHVVVAMAGESAEELRCVIYKDIGTFGDEASALQVTEALGETLRQCYPGTLGPDSHPRWECLVCGPEPMGVRAFKLASRHGFTPMVCGSYYGTIGSRGIADDLLGPTLSRQAIRPLPETLALVQWAMALSSQHFGADDIGGCLEWCRVTVGGISDIERADFNDLRRRATEVLSNDVVPILLRGLDAKL